MLRLATGAAVAAAAIAAPTLADAATHTSTAAAAETQPPNIIMIMVDDMRYDDLQAMPNTRRLLAGTNGANYTNNQTGTPLCSPSRATFLTGQYAHNHGVFENNGPTGGAGRFDDSSTLATWLNPTYQTIMVGKYMNEFGSGAADGTPPGYVPPGWDHFLALTEPSAGNYTDYNVNNDGTVSHVTNRYQTTFFGNRMAAEVEATLGANEPLFMWASFHAPHTGGGDGPDTYVPLTPKYRGAAKVGLPKSPAVDEAAIGDKPPWIRALPRLNASSRSQIVAERRERRDSLMYVDDQVGRLVDTVRAAGELHNTAFLFTSDNGYMQGEHRIRAGKAVPYAESARVPLLIRGPGFTPGNDPKPVSNVDLAPTIAGLAGVTPGLLVDGVSLLDPARTDRPLLIELPAGFDDAGNPAWVTVPPYASVIQNGDQYTDYATGDHELYDLSADPWQQKSLPGPVPAGLQVTLERLRNCAGEGCQR